MSLTWVERAELWLWGSCGYAPDDSVKELADWMEKAENWDAFKGVVPSDSKLFVVKPEYARMSRGDMATKLEAVKKYCLGVLEETKDFPNWMVIVRKLMRDILKILEAKG